jgi:hypothetical protein
VQARVKMQSVLKKLLTAIIAVAAITTHAAQSPAVTPGCEHLEARACLDQALIAMGGREKLAAVKTEHRDVISHRELMEQSYRQAPFITSYERDQVTLDFSGSRLIEKQHSVWPESDLRQLTLT